MDNELTRREFLEVSAAAGAAALTKLRPGIELTAEEQATLLAVVRDLFPHPGATDEAYARAATAIAERCRRDAAAFHDVTRGVAILEWNCLGGFAAAGERKRIVLLTMLKDSAFLRTVYGEALEAMYGSREAWRLFA